MQRNILATNPRVTRFKIDWEDNPGDENVAPLQNTDSNQMSVVHDQNSMSEPLKPSICSDISNTSMDMTV